MAFGALALIASTNYYFDLLNSLSTICQVRMKHDKLKKLKKEQQFLDRLEQVQLADEWVQTTFRRTLSLPLPLTFCLNDLNQFNFVEIAANAKTDGLHSQFGHAKGKLFAWQEDCQWYVQEGTGYPGTQLRLSTLPHKFGVSWRLLEHS